MGFRMTYYAIYSVQSIHQQLAFATVSGDMRVCFCCFDALTQARYFEIERMLAFYLCWMQDSNLGSLDRISTRLNPRCQDDWAFKDQAKNSIAHQWAFSLFHAIAGWLLHLALAIYMIVVVNFDTVTVANDFLIQWRKNYPSLLNAGVESGSLEPNLQQTECPLTNKLSYQGPS